MDGFYAVMAFIALVAFIVLKRHYGSNDFVMEMIYDVAILGASGCLVVFGLLWVAQLLH